MWLFWPSFNGSLASGNAQVRAIINTYFSMTGSVVTTFFFSMVFKEKLNKEKEKLNKEKEKLNKEKRKLNMVHMHVLTVRSS